jgi:hypothetical protein
MAMKKNQAIGLRVPESLKETLGMIAEKETRSVSQQAEHFIKQGIEKYVQENPGFDAEKKANKANGAQQSK